MKGTILTAADVERLTARVAEGQAEKAVQEAARAGYRAGFDEACRLMLEHLERLMKERESAE